MIPFIKEFEFEYGKPQQVTPLIRRVVAPNPGPFTYTGTGTYIVGRGTVAVIDPGPHRLDHLHALLAALEGETVSHVLVTHQHMDHSPLARTLADHFGAIVCGKTGTKSSESGGVVRLDAEDDDFFYADFELSDGWRAKGPGWTIRALHTPGHTANHFCFAVEEDNALLCGDHVMAWSTSVVSPPDGHMGDYLESLTRIRALDFATLIPAHGPEIRAPRAFIDAYIGHRVAREREIVKCLERGAMNVGELVETMYAGVDRKLHPAARHMVLAHLIHLAERGVVAATPGVSIRGRFRLANASNVRARISAPIVARAA